MGFDEFIKFTFMQDPKHDEEGHIQNYEGAEAVKN